MIVVTGAAGFIGSNLVHALNESSDAAVLAVDDFSDGRKFRNLVDCRIEDLVDKDAFARALASDHAWPQPIEYIYHLGACSDTTEWDGNFMLRNNYEYSKALLHYCADHGVPLIYASSASVYGINRASAEHPDNEAPLNLYAYSKLLFDRYVRRQAPHIRSQVVGLRYFNVYGPREQHKGKMASVAYHLFRQLREGGTARLFCGCDGFGDGEQRRDFIHVEDAVRVTTWFAGQPAVSGVFNVGTGLGRSFNDLARSVMRACGGGTIEYVPFPESLRGRYQAYTEADLAALHGAGFTAAFLTLEEGVERYVRWLREQPADA